MPSRSLQRYISGPYLVCAKHSGDKIVVVNGDSGSGSIDIGDGARIGSPTNKMVTPVRRRHESDHCSFSIAKKPYAGGGYCAAYAAGDANAVPSKNTSSTARATTYHPYN